MVRHLRRDSIRYPQEHSPFNIHTPQPTPISQSPLPCAITMGGRALSRLISPWCFQPVLSLRRIGLAMEISNSISLAHQQPITRSRPARISRIGPPLPSAPPTQ